jgi:hypothetical protein
MLGFAVISLTDNTFMNYYQFAGPVFALVALARRSRELDREEASCG